MAKSNKSASNTHTVSPPVAKKTGTPKCSSQTKKNTAEHGEVGKPKRGKKGAAGGKCGSGDAAQVAADVEVKRDHAVDRSGVKIKYVLSKNLTSQH